MQDLNNAAPAPGIATRMLQNRRLLQGSGTGVQVQASVVSPADSADAIGSAIQNAVSSGYLAQTLGELGCIYVLFSLVFVSC